MRRLLILGWIFALAACSATPTAPDVDPDPDDPDDPVVSAVAVSSPIGALMAVGGSTELEASATDAAGAAVATAFTWASTDPSVATVTAAGTVTGVAPGSTELRATAEGVTGALTLVVVDADLPGIGVLLDDALAVELIDGIERDGGPALGVAWAACETATADGNLTALRDCVVGLRTELAGDTEPATGPFRGLLGLFLDWIDRLLQLD